MRLADAITLVGTCQDMCPEFERVKRIVEKDVWREEGDPTVEDPGTRANRTAAETRMVKRFARSAAGQEEQLPSDLRPPQILQMTLDYLLDTVAGRAANLSEVHHFVWDRTRAIRNDFSIQQVSRKADVLLAINCYETITRFHIASLHQLAGLEKQYDEYDPQQEREQLDKTLLSLVQYYEDYKDYRPENEAEFRAYQIIFQVQRPSPDVEDRIQCWDTAIIQDPRVQHALAIYRAACNFYQEQGPLQPGKAHRVAQSNWMNFWNLIASPETSYLMGCIAEMFFPLVRRTALRALWRAFRPKANKESIEWTLEELQDVLGMETEKDVADYVVRFGFQLVQGDDESQRVDLGSVCGNLPDLQIVPGCTAMVARKRRGLKIPAVARNMERTEAREKGLVEEEEVRDGEDTGNTEEEQSLFVSQDSTLDRPSFNPFSTGIKGKASSQDTFGTTPGTSFATQSAIRASGVTGKAPPLQSAPQPQSQPNSTLSPPTRTTDNGPFSMQFQQQQRAKQTTSQAAHQTSPVPSQAAMSRNLEQEVQRQRPAQEAAEQETQKRRVQAAEEEKRAADARVREEQQKKRAAALEAERVAKDRAAREMAERRRQIAESAARERVLAEEEKQRAAAVQEAEQEAARRAKSQVLEDIARRMLLEPGGFLDQFVEYKANPLIQQVQQQVEDRLLQSEASNFRIARIQSRFGFRWREVCRVRKLARIGRERRARRRQGQEERGRRAKEASSIASDLDDFRRSQQSLRPSAASPPLAPTARKSVRFSRTHPPLNSSPASSTPPSASHRKYQQDTNVTDGTMAPPATAPRRNSRSSASPPLAIESYKVTNGVLSRSRQSPPDISSKPTDALPFNGLSYTEWMAQRRAARAKADSRDSTSSAYFRMKAVGLNPSAGSLSPYSTQKAHSPPSLKRPREADSLNDSHSKSHNTSTTLAPPDFDNPTNNRAIMPPPPPRKTAKLSPTIHKLQNTSVTSSANNASQSQHLATTTDDDDEFMAKVREIQNVFREGEDWYRNEIQEEKRRSAQSSRRNSLAGSLPQIENQIWAGHPAEGAVRKILPTQHSARWEPCARSTSRASSSNLQQYDSTPPPMAPLKYRSRASKFLPRDQYADARAARGESMFTGSARASQEHIEPEKTVLDSQIASNTTEARPRHLPATSPNTGQDDANGLLGPPDVAAQSLSKVWQDADVPGGSAHNPSHSHRVTSSPNSTYQSMSSAPDQLLCAPNGTFSNINSKPVNGTNTFASSANFAGFGITTNNTPTTGLSSALTTANSPPKTSPFASLARRLSNSEITLSPKQPSSQPSSRPSSSSKGQSQEKPLTNGKHTKSTNGNSQSAHTPSSSTESAGPFAIQAALQNPFASQYAQHNPFSTSTASLAPKSAKENPFTPSNSTKSSKGPNSIPPERQNPFQSSAKPSFGSQDSNPFAALANVDGNQDNTDRDDQSDSQVDGEHEREDEDGSADLGSQGSYDQDREVYDDESDGGELYDEEDENDDDEGASPGKLINGKSGASVEDAIEL